MALMLSSSGTPRHGSRNIEMVFVIAIGFVNTLFSTKFLCLNGLLSGFPMS